MDSSKKSLEILKRMAEQSKIETIESHKRFDTLVELFKKYNVSYLEKFDIANWDKADIETLKRCTNYSLEQICKIGSKDNGIM